MYLLETHIPAFPEVGHEFLIFRWGGANYGGKPGGPRVAFIHREQDEAVTGLEIHKCLKLLDIPDSVFWAHVDGCMVEPLAQKKSGLAESSIQASIETDKKPK